MSKRRKSSNRKRGKDSHGQTRKSSGSQKQAGKGVPAPALLPQVQAFIAALESELTAARRVAASNSIALKGGKLSRTAAGQFVYVFSLESVLFLASDSPADLLIPGKEPINATIVAVEGLSLTLAVGEKLGEFVPAARLQSDPSLLIKRLIERLRERGVKSSALQDALLAGQPVVGSRIGLSDSNGLNREQVEAVEFAVGHNLTFIHGPPGTGKTSVIGATAKELMGQRRRVLIVSHTNVAVDQAVLRVAESGVGEQELESGAVIRIGTPRDAKFAALDRLTLKYHVEKRSEELAERRSALESESEVNAHVLNELEAILELARLIDNADRDRRKVVELSDNATAAAEAVSQRTADLKAAEAKAAALCEKQEDAKRGRKLELDRATRVAGRRHVEQKLRGAQDYLRGVHDQLETTRRQQAEVDSSQWMRDALRHLPTPAVAQASAMECEAKFKRLSDEYAAILATFEEAKRMLAVARNAGWLKRRIDRVPSVESALRKATDLQERSQATFAEYESARLAYGRAKGVLDEVEKTAWMRDKLARMPSPEETADKLRQLEAQVATTAAAVREFTDEIGKDSAYIDGLERELAVFVGQHGQSPSEILEQVELGALAVELARKAKVYSEATYAVVQAELSASMKSLAAKFRSAGLVFEDTPALAAFLAVLDDAVREARSRVKGLSLEQIESEIARYGQRQQEIAKEISAIEDQLKLVECEVIQSAQIVAATLTGTYMRDTLTQSLFDTIILDEASMAPIPAVWHATGLASKAAIIVGDPDQLPPIVVAETKGSLEADNVAEVLGKSVFDRLVWRSKQPVLQELLEQHRMHPEIAVIPNTLVYGRRLRNGPATLVDLDAFQSWFAKDSGFDRPVTLVNTNSLNAWVTAVNRGGRSSRMNFLSASLCVEVASQALRRERPAHVTGSPPRILIVSPYRPHAQLVSLMLRDESLEGEVLSGTAHSFQGSEADMVILDLVNDDPHWKVRMFIPANDKQMKQLLNVAVTRARRRLVVVGDLDYVAARAKNAFAGSKFVSMLKAKYHEVDAKDVTPHGAAALAARAVSLTAGGTEVPPLDRLVTTQDQFYEYLTRDILGAKERIVIFSPFATSHRVALLEPHLREAVGRNVAVTLVTKSHKERGRDLQTYQRIEKQLTAWGVRVLHKYWMHEKLVFIDDDVIWSGSLNTLSFSKSREHMERRKSPKVVAEYAEIMGLDDLLDDAAKVKQACSVPGCRGEVVWREGGRGAYWQCLTCKFTRNPGDPELENGEIRCRTCRAELALGDWGGKPAWRCTGNARHRTAFSKAHLRLPAMRRKLSTEQLDELEAQERADTDENASREPETDSEAE